MKKYLLLIAILTTVKTGYGQNLIPNPGFENISTMYCGIFLTANFDSSINVWYNPTQATPDLFSTQVTQSCWNYQPNSTYPGPICLSGSQTPHSGNVFAGLFSYTIPGFNQREYIQSPLSAPMIPGNSYYVEFYLSLADNHEKYIDRMGACFTVAPATLATDDPLPLVPQVEAQGFLSDATNWVKISGTFQASSAFEYITIGNFYDDNNTSTQLNPGGTGGPGCYGAYYYIDDVLVSDVTGINDPDGKNLIHVFPTVFSDRISITTEGKQPCEFILYDTALRKLYHQNFISTLNIPTEPLAKGMYVYQVLNKDGVIGKGKVVKK